MFKNSADEVTNLELIVINADTTKTSNTIQMPPRRNDLPIWNYFDRSSDGNKTAICNICHRELSYKTTVTNLKTHLKQRHSDLYSEYLSLNESLHSSSVLENQSVKDDPLDVAVSQTESPPIKIKKYAPRRSPVDFERTSILYRRPEKEEEILAKTWAIKLSRLNSDQKRFAEKIINDTLFEAEMGTLTRNGVYFLTTSDHATESPQ